MRIAFVTPQMIVGGAETYIERKSQWLLSQGNEVIIISEGGCYVGNLPQSIHHIEFKGLSSVPYTFSPYCLKKKLSLLSDLLIKNKIDIIEAHNPYAILYVSMSYRIHCIPFVMNILSELSFDNNPELLWLTKKISKKGLYYTLTSEMHDYVERKCGRKIHVNILPIPLNIPRSSRVKDTEKYILSVSRMSLDKMYVKYLMYAFEEIYKSEQLEERVYLYIVGDGICKDEVDSIAESINAKIGYPIIQMKGTVVGDKLDELYRNCIAFVGMGTCLLMSASFGKPTILASAFMKLQPYAWGFWGMNPDLDKNTIVGTINYNSYKQDFKDIIISIIQDKILRVQAGERAYSLFKSVYSIDGIMVKWQHIYDKIRRKAFDYSLGYYGVVLYIWNCAYFYGSRLKKVIKI